MSDFKFNCPSCGQHLAAEESWVGGQIQCPSCQQALVVPAPAAPNPTRVPSPSGLRIAGVDKSAPPPSSNAPGTETGSFCTKCGKPFAPGAAFCGVCGDATGQGRPGTVRPPIPAPAQSGGLPENAAGGLCYVGGWVTGLIFLLIDRRPFVRFHAAQSLVVFGGLTVFWIIFGRIMAMVVSSHVKSSIRANPHQPPDMSWMSSLGLVSSAIGLLGLVLWLVCMISAFRGGRYQVPIAGDIAESIARK